MAARNREAAEESILIPRVSNGVESGGGSDKSSDRVVFRRVRLPSTQRLNGGTYARRYILMQVHGRCSLHAELSANNRRICAGTREQPRANIMLPCRQQRCVITRSPRGNCGQPYANNASARPNRITIFDTSLFFSPSPIPRFSRRRFFSPLSRLPFSLHLLPRHRPFRPNALNHSAAKVHTDDLLVIPAWN